MEDSVVVDTVVLEVADAVLAEMLDVAEVVLT
jgi:hypothetical protein